MSTPRTKRQFAGAAADPSQRQITSFFDQPTTTVAILVTTGKLRGPVLPATIQSNLLSVGMRIRKSVPEGYKTIGTSAFKLWTDDRPANSASATGLPTKLPGRELLPFCGINRVGGFDTQPLWGPEDFAPSVDEVPGLTLSQDTVDDDETIEPSRKRIFEAEEDEETKEQESTRSLAPMGLRNDRIRAIPRSRAKKLAPRADVGQENVAVVGDFDDCDFLVYDKEREMDVSG